MEDEAVEHALDSFEPSSSKCEDGFALKLGVALQWAGGLGFSGLPFVHAYECECPFQEFPAV